MFLSRDRSVHHDEVMHVMAWRSLMALRTFLGGRRRMEKLRNTPRSQRVAAAAFASKQSAVWVSVAMATRTIEIGLFRFVRLRDFQEILKVRDHLTGDRVRRSAALSGKAADPQEHCVIHLGRTGATRMFEMTPSALFARRVERRRLLSQVRSGRRMAGDAGGSLDAPHRRVTSFAFVGQERVFFRERSGNYCIPPPHNGRRPAFVQRRGYRCHAGDGERDAHAVDDSSEAHASHRSP